MYRPTRSSPTLNSVSIIRSRTKKLLALIVVIASSILFFSCSDSATAAPGGRTNATVTTAPPLVAPVFDDQTGSNKFVLVDAIGVQSLDRIIAYGRANGCDIALGAIRSTSNRPLIRLFIDAPEPKPLPPVTDNIYGAIEEEATFKTRLATWQRGESERLRGADAAIATFRSAAATLLAHPANAHTTDLNGAIERARLFLNERRVFGRGGKIIPIRAAIFKTDGIETASSRITAKPFDADVIVITVNDTANVLPAFRPIPFEALTPAVNWLCRHAEEVRR